MCLRVRNFSRFGKTFSIAIFVACLCLSFGCECVIFSPARRASRKLLERICEFVKLLDCEDKIIEYNQENLRLISFTGKRSLIRSFPSKDLDTVLNAVSTAPPPQHISILTMLLFDVVAVQAKSA